MRCAPESLKPGSVWESNSTRAMALADLMLTGAGEILQRWIEGEFSRQQVATLLGRIIMAVLNEFTE